MKLWKIQKFFGDVVYDLRSRRLLPVVILLVLALVAVPVLISQTGNGSSNASIKPASGSANAVPETERAVMAYLPSGIRNYKKRLDDQSAKNPFRDQFSQPAAAASASSQLNSTVTPPAAVGASSAVGTSSTVGAGSGGSATSGSTTLTGPGDGSGSGGTKKKQKKSKKTTYSYSVSVYAGDVSAPLTSFPKIAPLTMLPSQDSSVVLFYGLSTDHKLALFLVSNKVDGLTGPGSCLPAPDDCSLLALPAGASEDLHYSKDGKTYRIAVAQIKRTAK